jgi:hypothetical protein
LRDKRVQHLKERLRQFRNRSFRRLRLIVLQYLTLRPSAGISALIAYTLALLYRTSSPVNLLSKVL